MQDGEEHCSKNVRDWLNEKTDELLEMLIQTLTINGYKRPPDLTAKFFIEIYLE